MFRNLSTYRFLLFLGILAGPLFSPCPADAKDTYPARIPNGGVFSCFTCHTTSLPARNSFGADFKDNGSSWSAALADQDSDLDGRTNGEELLDPSGSWSQGDANPGIPNDVTNPGAADVFADPTATHTAVPQPSATSTNTSAPQATATPTNTSSQPQATATPTNTSAAQATSTPTNTSPPGEPTATPTQRGNGEDDTEVTGTLSGLNSEDQTFLLEGVLIRVHSETVVLDEDNEPIDFEDLRDGDTVEVEGTLLEDGSVRAKKVKIEDDSGHGESCETEFKGFVTEVNLELGTLVIDGQTILTDEMTEYRDHQNQIATLADFVVGASVEVKGTPQDGGAILACRLKLEDDEDEQETCETEFTGTVSEIDLGLGTLVVNGQTILTDDQTVYLDHNNHPASLAIFVVGSLVEVKGTPQDGGAILACRLKLEDDEHEEETCETEFTGTVSEIDLDLGLLVVNGQLVVTDTATVLLGHEHQSISLSDLSVGEVVEIKGTPQSDGSVLACRIKSENEMEDCEREFKGVISEINEASKTLVVGRVLLRVGDSTEILDHDRNPIGLANLSIGDLVEIKYCPNSGVPPLAQRIKLEDEEGQEDLCEIEIEGSISDLDLALTTLVVNGTFIQATGASVKDDHGAAISFSDLAVGNFVKVKGCLNPDSSVQATSIRRKSESESECESKVRGNLTLIDPNAMTLSVGLVSVQVNQQTVIIDDRTDQAITFGDLVLGSSLKVEFCSRTGTPVAIKIEVKGSDDYDLDGDGEYEEHDVLEVLRELQRQGLNIDYTGDNRTTGDDLTLSSRGWKQ